MPIDAAPRITKWVTVVLMAAVLMLCLLVDSMKCRPGGRDSLCIGDAVSITPCTWKKGEEVNCSMYSNPEYSGRSNEQRPTRTTIYILEVLPTDSSNRLYKEDGRTVADFFAPYADLDHFCGASQFLWCPPGIRTEKDEVVIDRISFPYRNYTDLQSMDLDGKAPTWIADLQEHLPKTTLELGYKTTVRKHFPSLYNHLKQIATSQGASGTSSISLCTYVVINPGVHMDMWAAYTGASDVNGTVRVAESNFQQAYHRVARSLLISLGYHPVFGRIVAVTVTQLLRVGFPSNSFRLARGVPAVEAVMGWLYQDPTERDVNPPFTNLILGPSTVLALMASGAENAGTETCEGAARHGEEWQHRQRQIVSSLEESQREWYTRCQNKSRLHMRVCNSYSLQLRQDLLLDNNFMEQYINCFLYAANAGLPALEQVSGNATSGFEVRANCTSNHMTNALQLTTPAMERFGSCLGAVLSTFAKPSSYDIYDLPP